MKNKIKETESDVNKTLIELDDKSISHAESESSILKSNNSEDKQTPNKDLKGVNVHSWSLILVRLFLICRIGEADISIGLVLGNLLLWRIIPNWMVNGHIKHTKHCMKISLLGIQTIFPCFFFIFYPKIFRTFFDDAFENQFSKQLSESELNSLWAVINCLLPLGAIFGSLGSSFLVDYFGRYLKAQKLK
jgi:hypothetical protein